MKNHRKIFALIVSALIAWPVIGQTYDEREIADLRAFLRQPSAEEGKANIAQWSTIDTTDWTTSDAWLSKYIGITWTEEIEGVKYIKGINWFSKNLGGTLSLPHCAYLESLNVASNTMISAIDISQNTNLKQLTATSTAITGIDVSKNTRLTHLTIGTTDVTTVDVSKNPNLEQLDVQNTGIAELDLSQNPLLKSVYTTGCRLLENIDFSSNLSMTTLNCNKCPRLTRLNLSSLGNLTRLVCDESPISELDLRANTKLTALMFRNSTLKNLVLPNSPTLTTLYLENNYLTELSGLAQLTGLADFRISGNKLSVIDVSANTAINTFYCNDNELTEIKGLENLTNLKEFQCQNNFLTSLTDVPVTKLQTLFCYGNRLKFSTLPTRTQPSNTPYKLISNYHFHPQDTISAGAIDISAPIDLSNEYSKTIGNTTKNTVFSWFDISDGTEQAIEMNSSGNGIFQATDALKGKSLRCKMTNPLFYFNNKITNETAFPLVYEVYIAGDETYAETEVAKLKDFLRQPSAETEKCNAQALGIDTSAWNTDNLWLHRVEGLTLTDGNEKHIRTIEWPARRLAGSLDLTGFTSLTLLDIADNRIVSLKTEDSENLETIFCQNNQLRFSTLPRTTPSETFHIAPQAILNGGRIAYSDNVDLRAEAEVTMGQTTTTTVYEWFDISGETETKLTTVTGNNGLFEFPAELAGKTLQCRMTNQAYWGTTEAQQLTQIFEVRINPWSEPVYDRQEIAQLKNFLRQPAADYTESGESNFEKLGLGTADTSAWTSSTLWLEEIEGITWTQVDDTLYIAAIEWGKKNLGGELALANSEYLTSLALYDNNLKTIDISGCPLLKEMTVYNNHHCTELDLTGCTALTKLYAQNCALETLDIADCGALQYIQAFNNKLTEFDASGKTALTHLYLYDNLLDSIDLSGCTALANIDVANNRLFELNIASDADVSFLKCGGNNLNFATLPQRAIASYNFVPQAAMTGKPIHYAQGIDLIAQNSVTFPSEQPVITHYEWFEVTSGTEIALNDSALTNNGNGMFSIHPLLSGRDLRCKMTNAKFPGLTLTYDIALVEDLSAYNADELEDLRRFCRQESTYEGIDNGTKMGLLPGDTANWYTSAKWLNRLTSLGRFVWDIRDLGTEEETRRLVELHVNSMGLAGHLALPSCTELLKIMCYAQKLNGIDISNCTKLHTLWCQNNEISELEVSKCNKLTTLYCEINRLSSLKLENHPEMLYLRCNENQLTTLDISGCSNLRNLNCSSNQLTELDLSKNTSLTELFITKNRLEELDLSNNQELFNFDGSHNFFRFFDFAKHNKKLYKLLCTDNLLEGIVLSGLRIETVDIRNNKLTYATIPFDFSRKDYYFAPQDTVDLGTIEAGERLDISDQYMLDSDGSHTSYHWEELSGSTFIETDDVTTVDETGIFFFDKDAVGKRFRCTLTNNNIYRSALTLEFFVNVVLEVKNEDKDPVEITVRPNPTSGIVTVSSASEINCIRLYNSSGRLVFETQKNGSADKTIDLSAYPSGLYFLKADDRIVKIIRK